MSGNPYDPESVLYPEALLRGWWGLWLVGNFVGNIAWRFSDPQKPDLYILGLWADIFSSLCAIGASVLLAAIVKRIDVMQGQAQRAALVFA